MNISQAHRNTKKAASKKAAQQSNSAPTKGEKEASNDKVSLSYFPQSPGMMPDSYKEFDGKIILS